MRRLERNTPRRDAASRLDTGVGGMLERGVRAHHRRRLAKLGKHPLDAPPGGWASDAPPPRPGNRMAMLIDGEEALGRMVEAISRATRSVWLTGWFLSPEFAMQAQEDPVVVRNLLAEAARRVDVRVLLWAGAPLPVFTPSRRMVRAVREQLTSAGVRCELDARERPLHCHHEKTLIVDSEIAFVGGIDLTALAGNRLDSPRHPPRAATGWHDVAAEVEGPAVADVARHFADRWFGVTRERLEVAEVAARGTSTVQFVRTVPEHRYPAWPLGSFGILETYVRAIRSARELISLESQYLWSVELVQLLAEKLRNPPSDRFRVLLLLPGKPYGGADDTKGALAQLVDADGGAGRVLACALYAPAGAVADLIYVHAKLAVIDDRVLIVGSANLNDHSMFNDTEAAVVTDDAELARGTRLRLWAEHLECRSQDVAGDPTGLIDGVWRPRAEEQYELRRAGRPMTRRITRLDHVSRRTARLLGPLEGLAVDG